MNLKHVGGKPVVKATKTEQRQWAATRDSLETLALVEPDAKTAMEYLTCLIGRTNEETGEVQPVKSDEVKPDLSEPKKDPDLKDPDSKAEPKKPR